MTQPPRDVPPAVIAFLSRGSAATPTPAELDALEGAYADAVEYNRRVCAVCGCGQRDGGSATLSP